MSFPVRIPTCQYLPMGALVVTFTVDGRGCSRHSHSAQVKIEQPAGPCALDPTSFEVTFMSTDTSRPVRALVVDDNPDIREFVSRVLESTGCEVHVATDGEQGLSEALEFQPDVVFLDIKLPKQFGWLVCGERSRCAHETPALQPGLDLVVPRIQTDRSSPGRLCQPSRYPRVLSLAQPGRRLDLSPAQRSRVGIRLPRANRYAVLQRRQRLRPERRCEHG
jgi:hypothetical protein